MVYILIIFFQKVDFDFTSLSTDELLNNLDFLFKDEQSQQRDLFLNSVSSSSNNNNIDDDVTVIDNDVELIEEIKNEPIEPSFYMAVI